MSIAATALLFSGCATPDRVRLQAQGLLAEGQYESALDLLQQRLDADPESPTLRAGALQVRNQALSLLIADASVARAAGQLDKAAQLLQRALKFDLDGQRVQGLLSELDVERRQLGALAQAEAVAATDARGALSIVELALKSNPRQAALLKLRRRLEASLREAQLQALTKGLLESRPISLDFRDVNLRTLLDVVTRNSEVSFVLDPDVSRDIQVSVFLKSVPVEEAIDLITSSHGLAKKVLDQRTILIYPNTPEKRREYQEQVVRLFYLTNADARRAADFLSRMLAIKEPFVDERSNFVALRETPENIVLAERLLAMFDTPEPEVVLELEVIEIRTARLLDLGVKIPDSISLTPLAPDGSSAGLTLGNLGSLSRGDIAVTLGSVLLNLKRETGDFNTLANPRIRARSREKARILVGDKVPVVTTTTGQGGFVSDNINYLDVGLKLEIQPTVYADNDVAMALTLEVSSVSREIQTAGGGLAYQIGTRNASTLLRLRDGETQVLAGLLSREERSSASRIPGLGDLPVAGRLFSSQRDDNSRTELVLAITPRVVRNISVPQISESELWVGTEADTRLRGPMGRSAPGVVPAPAAGADRVSGNARATASSPSGAVQTAGDPAGVAPAGGLNLSWSGQTRAVAGQPIVVGLDLEAATGLDGISAALRYDPASLRLVSVSEGDFFRRSGDRSTFRQDHDASQGVVQVTVARESGRGGPGIGRVLELQFLPLSEGEVDVGLIRFQPEGGGSPGPSVVLPPTWRIRVGAP